MTQPEEMDMGKEENVWDYARRFLQAEDPQRLIEAERPDIALILRYIMEMDEQNQEPGRATTYEVYGEEYILPVRMSVMPRTEYEESRTENPLAEIANQHELAFTIIVEDNVAGQARSILKTVRTKEMKKKKDQGIIAPWKIGEKLAEAGELGNGRHLLMANPGQELENLCGDARMREIIRRIVRRKNRCAKRLGNPDPSTEIITARQGRRTLKARK